LTEEEKKQTDKPRHLITEAKTSPPPEPVNILPFQAQPIKKGLTKLFLHGFSFLCKTTQNGLIGDI